jgi:hypothetical protein
MEVAQQLVLAEVLEVLEEALQQVAAEMLVQEIRQLQHQVKVIMEEQEEEHLLADH